MVGAKDIGMKVKMARITRGITQAELAEKAGVSRKTVWRIESGDCEGVAFGLVVRVLSAAGFDVDLVRGQIASPRTAPEDFDVDAWLEAKYYGDGSDG